MSEVLKNWKAYTDLILAMAISGSAVVVSKMMVSTLPTFLATELGIAIGMLFLIPYTFGIKKERNKLDWKTHLVLFAQALCGILLYRVFTFVGLTYTTAANSGLITSASPILVIIFAFIILREKIKLNQIIGVIFVVVGVILIHLYTYLSANSESGSITGNILVMTAVVCEALFSILSKVACKPMSALYRTTIIVCYAFVLLSPFALQDARQYDFSKLDNRTILCVLYYGIFVSVLSYILWFRGVEKVAISEAAAITSVVPISSVFLSGLLLKEKISVLHIVSLFFVVVGIGITCMEGKKNWIRVIFNLKNTRKIQENDLL